MASVNRVMIMGNLGQDPELRYTQNQNAVVTLNVATTDVRNSADGQKQEITEWHRIVVWGKQAENCAKYLSKGRPVFIEGRLQTRAWEDKQGQKRYTTEIVAQNVQFLGGRDQGASQQAGHVGAQSHGGGSSSVHDPIPDIGSGFGGPSTPGGALDDIPF